MRFGFRQYALVSTSILCGVIVYNVVRDPRYYHVMLHLTTSKAALMVPFFFAFKFENFDSRKVIGNFLMMLSYVVGVAAKRVFLGTARDRDGEVFIVYIINFECTLGFT